MQIKKKKILFVCTCNLNRSPTFEKYFKERFKDFIIKSAGTLYGYPYILNEGLCKWADIIYVMDLSHKKYIYERFNQYEGKVQVIGISDQYDTDSPQLIELIHFWIEKGFV